MKTLVLGRHIPWQGPRSGNPIRRTSVIRGLAQNGPVTFALLGSPAEFEPFEAVDRTVWIPAEYPKPSTARSWAIRQRASMPLPFANFAGLVPQAADALRSEVAHHDLVWFDSSVVAELALPYVHSSSAVGVDLDDLESDKNRQAIVELRHHRSLKFLGPMVFQWLQRRAWDKWVQRIAACVEVVTVSKAADVATVGTTNVHLVPNGCDLAPRSGARATNCPPTLLFVGLLRYKPNRDACLWLVHEVLPELRRWDPSIQVRLVGEPDEVVQGLGDYPDVTVTGYVPDIQSEMTRADLVLVPLQQGSGTRLKILEAFSQQIPVVSTSIGCEGHDIRDGQELLIADSAADFADAIRRGLTDDTLRRELCDNAYQFARKHDWRVTQSVIAHLTREVVETSQLAREEPGEGGTSC